VSDTCEYQRACEEQSRCSLDEPHYSSLVMAPSG
jgi:hypothetical protein